MYTSSSCLRFHRRSLSGTKIFQHAVKSSLQHDRKDFNDSRSDLFSKQFLFVGDNR